MSHEFIFSQLQVQFSDAAAAFAAEKLPLDRLRTSCREPDVDHDSSLWKAAVDQGYPSILIQENYGGLGLGFRELGAANIELGRYGGLPTLLPVSLAAETIQRFGTDQAKEKLLPAIASGERLVVPAIQETPRFSLDTNLLARRSGNEYLLTGAKRLVLSGSQADSLLVTARLDNDSIIFLEVPTDSSGVTLTDGLLVDARRAALLELNDAAIPIANVVIDEELGSSALTHLSIAASTLLTVESLGGAERVFETTLEYLKTREQFGVVIGSFQALKHRAAEMFAMIELLRSVVLALIDEMDSGEPSLVTLACAGKARAADVYMRVASEAIQMHGGIGMTDECDVGLFYKHARVLEQLFGDATFQKARFASLSGY